MKFVWVGIYLGVLGSVPSRADYELFTPQNFAVLCEPGNRAANEVNREDRAELEGIRAVFLPFLAHPERTIRRLRQGPLVRPGADIAEMSGHMVLLSQTCTIAEGFAPQLQERGCRNRKGRKLDHRQALALCASLDAEMKKADGASHRPSR